jgi:hypothetical protein
LSGPQPARRGLWADIALDLALLALAAVVLNAGLFWLVVRQWDVERQADLAMSLGSALAAQLGAESADGDPNYRRVLQAYDRSGIRDLAVLGPDGALLAGDAAPDPAARITAAIHASVFTRVCASAAVPAHRGIQVARAIQRGRRI